MQKGKMLALLALVVLLAGGVAFAGPMGGSANSSDAVLQVTDYSLIPPTPYAGTAGYVKLTLANTGTADATGISVYYDYSQSTSQLVLYAGTISANSNAQVTIPFKVPQQLSGGIYLINMNIYYTPSTSTSQKLSSFSVPIIVSQYEPLEVSTRGSTSGSIAPGDKFQLILAVNNTGGVVNNLLVTTPQNSSFSLEGTTQESLGDIPSGSGTNVTISLVSSSSTPIGQYTIPLVFTYQDASGNTASETLYVGPVSVLEASTQFRLSMEPLSATEVGSEATFKITLENSGTNPLTAIVDVNSTTAFTPLGVSRLYFESVEPGQSVSQNVTIGISNSVTAGYYELPLTVTLSSGNVVTQNVGVPVSATSDLTVTASSQSSAGIGGGITIEISNTGNAAIRSVYVTTSSQDYTILGTSDKFVGTLNVDDFTTLSLTATPRGGATGNRTITVTTSFKDTNNIQHVVTKTVTVESSGIATTTLASFGNRRNQGVIFGLSWEEIIGGVVVIVIAYFAYRHFRKRGAKA